jgi:hypothetical protein
MQIVLIMRIVAIFSAWTLAADCTIVDADTATLADANLRRHDRERNKLFR